MAPDVTLPTRPGSPTALPSQETFMSLSGRNFLDDITRDCGFRVAAGGRSHPPEGLRGRLAPRHRRLACLTVYSYKDTVDVVTEDTEPRADTSGSRNRRGRDRGCR